MQMKKVRDAYVCFAFSQKMYETSDDWMYGTMRVLSTLERVHGSPYFEWKLVKTSIFCLSLKCFIAMEILNLG